MEGENNGFDKLLELLPAGWKEKAKELKALVRTRGNTRGTVALDTDISD
jgi:hypothetical protein